jgi:hypothetical protein
VTASQVVALFQTTWNSEIINFINGGDFVVSAEKYAVAFSSSVYHRFDKEQLVQF